MLMTVNNYSRAIKLTSRLRGSFKQLKLQKLDFNTSPRLGSTKKEQPLEESKLITGFSTTNECYQFCKMPFGLINAVTSFNKTMRKLLADVKDAEAYVDDAIEHTVT